MERFDSYELRARITPALIVSLPVIVTFLVLVFGIPNSFTQFLGSGVISIALIYAFSFVVRHQGKKIETDLWSSWGGPPSTRFMRWRDDTFGDELKRQMHSSVKQLCQVNLRSEKEETEDPEEADQQVAQAFVQVRAIVRQEDSEDISAKHNAEYGFNRNLLGSRTIWLVLSVLGAALCAIAWYWRGESVEIAGTVINVVLIFFHC